VRDGRKATASTVAGGSSTQKPLRARNPKLETLYWFDLTYDALLADVSRLAEATPLLMFPYLFADSEGQTLHFEDDVKAAAVAKPPPRGLWFFETYLAPGIVGAYTYTYESLHTAADMALKFFRGPT